MSIVTDLTSATTLVLTNYDANQPFIGWDNQVVAANISSTNEDPSFPITNVANPATHLKFKAATTAFFQILIDIPADTPVDYIAIAGHNFADSITHSNWYASTLAALLHFNGADASTTITSNAYDSHTWTAHGNAQIDTAQSKFGGASLLLDGTGDYVDTPDHVDYTLSTNNFTIDCWVRPNASGAISIAGQADAAGLANSDSAWRIRKNASNFIEAAVVEGTTVTTISGTTTTMVNGTWYHIALIRSDDILYLYQDGILQAQGAFAGTVNDSTEPLTVGRGGSITGSEWNGWIDEFRMVNGSSMWTSNFTPPTVAYQTENLLDSYDPDPILDGNSPIIVRFPVMQSTAGIQLDLELTPFGSLTQIGVIYAGLSLIMERSIKLEPDHVPINLGRKTRMVNGMSESGNFLGRIVLSQYSETKAEFSYITQDWYRANMDDFVIAAKEVPFFWAWNPEENPTDVGYSWLMSDPQPAIDPVTRRVSIELQMRAVTE